MLTLDERKKYFSDLGLGAYNKSNIKRFQKTAFSNAKEHDGIYGPKTDTALIHWWNVRHYTKNFIPEEFKCGCGGKQVYLGAEQSLGNITLGSGGYYAFTRPTLPSGAILIGYQVAFGSSTGAWNVPPYYGTNAYVIGTPNASITNLRVYPIYYI